MPSSGTGAASTLISLQWRTEDRFRLAHMPNEIRYRSRRMSPYVRDLLEELPIPADGRWQDMPDVGPHLVQSLFLPSRSSDNNNLASYSQMICIDVPTSNLRLGDLSPE